MRKINFCAVCLKIGGLLLAIISGAAEITAQCSKDITIRSVRRTVSNPRRVSVLLTVPAPGLYTEDKKQILENEKNWLVFDPDTLGSAVAAVDAAEQRRILAQTVIEVQDASLVASLEPANLITQIEVELTMAADLSGKINYLVKINNLSSPGCLTAPILSTIVKPPPTKETTFAKSKDRKDSDVYVQGLLEGARKAKAIYSIDALVKRRFGLGVKNYLEPFFELKTSTARRADSDAAALGLNHIRTLGLFRDGSTLDFANGIKLESDTNFKNVNLVYQTRADFAIPGLAGQFAGQPIALDPFIGLELGGNFRSPVPEAKGRLIARPLVGANLYYQIYRSNEKVFSFQTQYIRRFLLNREVAFKTDDDGNFVPLPISGKPRDYVKSVFGYDFSKNFGLTASYEYGALPPKFVIVDSKYSFGIVFKGKFVKE